MFDEYDYPDDGHTVFAMDQFIGEPEYWSKGIGSSFLKMMVAYLKENMAQYICMLTWESGLFHRLGKAAYCKVPQVQIL